MLELSFCEYLKGSISFVIHSIHKALLRQEVDVHGKIYTDGEFGSLKLSDDLSRWTKLSFKLWKDNVILTACSMWPRRKGPKLSLS